MKSKRKKFKEKAIKRAQEKLRRPDALDYIDDLIMEKKRQNKVLKNQINNLSGDIVLQMEESLDILQGANKLMEEIKKDISNVHRRSKTNNHLIHGYTNVKRIHTTLSNINKTIGSLRIFRRLKEQKLNIKKTFASEYENLKHLLGRSIPDFKIPPKYDQESDDFLRSLDSDEEDEDNEDEKGSDSQHYKYDMKDVEDSLSDVQEDLNRFRNLGVDIELQLKNLPKQLEVLTEKLKFFKELELDFEDLFRCYVHYMMVYGENYPKEIEGIRNLIEKQERDDRINERTYGKEAVKKVYLKDKFFSEIKRSIEEQFDFEKKEIKNIEVILKQIERIVEDLQFVEEYVGRHFPKGYDVTKKYIETTYIATTVFLTTKAKRGISNDDILHLIKWLQSVYPSLFEKYKEYEGAVRINTDLTHVVQSLEDDFINKTKRILEKWSDNVVDSIFSKDMVPVDIGKGEAIYTTGPRDLFQAIAANTQQVIDFGLKKVLVRVLVAINGVLILYTQKVKDSLERKRAAMIMKKNLSKKKQKEEETADDELDDDEDEEDLILKGVDISEELCSFIPYINDFSNLIRYLDRKRRELLDTKLIESEKLKWMSSFQQILERDADDILEKFKSDLKLEMQPHYSLLFGRQWRNGNPVVQRMISVMTTLVNDLDDFEEEYQEEIDLIEDVVIEYIRRLYFSKIHIGDEELKLLRKDYQMFRSEQIFKRDHLKALKLMRNLLVFEDENDFALNLGKIRKKFPDFPKELALNLINKCEIQNRNLKLKAIDSIEYNWKEDERNQIGRETFFSRLNLKKR